MYRKTIAAALATLSLAAVATPVAQAGNKFSPMKPTSGVATFPYRSGHMTKALFGHHTYRILLSTWS